jgi:hypothetical protein
MKRYILSLSLSFLLLSVFAGTVEKTYIFSNYKTNRQGIYTILSFENTTLMGKTGEPALPFHPVSLMLPPGEKAVSMTLTFEEETIIPGAFLLFPMQEARPLSKGSSGEFVRNETVYRSSQPYPSQAFTTVQTQYMNGYAFALAAFTPVKYNPASGTVTIYKKVTVHIETAYDNKSLEALKNLSSSKNAGKRVKAFTQNPEEMERYSRNKSSSSGYQLLIITSPEHVSGFDDLVAMYNNKGIVTQVASTLDISTTMTGQDLQEKIRNYIVQEYQNNSIEYVLLGGDVELIPYRGFYCYVVSGSGYEDWNIPADLYYSSLDGNWNTNGDSKWGEPGEDDLLPEVAVGRLPFSNSTELAAMVHKSIAYQTDPVLGEFDRPLMVGEHLYDDPMTEGGDFMDLLINDHNDNGYFTYGIPSADNDIEKLYDISNIWQWTPDSLLAKINRGKSFIHHLGHSNSMYMMRLYIWDITNENFSLVNGVDHNYTLAYTQGCDAGSFDQSDCIAEAAVAIDNFLAAGIFNSRYGWFNQGTTDGPSQHLQREFVSALYHPNSPIYEIGAVQVQSKIMTAPFVGLPGEFEPGAQRWCFYDCNLLGDPAMTIWTHDPSTGIVSETTPLNFSVYPNPAKDKVTVSVNAGSGNALRISVFNSLGQEITELKPVASGPGTVHAEFSVSGFQPGVYFCKVETNSFTGIRKIIVTK